MLGGKSPCRCFSSQPSARAQDSHCWLCISLWDVGPSETQQIQTDTASGIQDKYVSIYREFAYCAEAYIVQLKELTTLLWEIQLACTLLSTSVIMHVTSNSSPSLRSSWLLDKVMTGRVLWTGKQFRSALFISFRASKGGARKNSH